MQKLNADMSKISDSANFIKSEADKYTQTYMEIFNQLRAIDGAWDGVDNDEFNKKFGFLEKDFIEMTMFLEKTVNHLILSGEAYKTVGNAIARSAGSLNKLNKSSSKK